MGHRPVSVTGRSPAGPTMNVSSALPPPGTLGLKATAWPASIGCAYQRLPVSLGAISHSRWR
jgi:hypothetical protein